MCDIRERGTKCERKERKRAGSRRHTHRKKGTIDERGERIISRIDNKSERGTVGGRAPETRIGTSRLIN